MTPLIVAYHELEMIVNLRCTLTYLAWFLNCWMTSSLHELFVASSEGFDTVGVSYVFRDHLIKSFVVFFFSGN